MRKLSLALAAGSVLCAALSPAIGAADPGSRQTREYLQQAAASDTFEIMEGTTALAQSQNPQVRSFAQRMIADHTNSSRMLADAATRAGLKPPEKALMSDQSQMLAALQSARGPQFDQLYFRQQALAHHSALTVQQAYAAGGDTRELKQVASTTVPLVSQHLQMAEQMQRQMGG